MNFFQKWSKNIQQNVKGNSQEEASKIEFYLQLYFVVYNINPQCGDKNVKSPS
jgi:hypothetical protein